MSLRASVRRWLPDAAAVAVGLVAVTVVGVVGPGRPSPPAGGTPPASAVAPVGTVRVAGDLHILDNPSVAAALGAEGLRVQQIDAGPAEACRSAGAIDVLIGGGDPPADCQIAPGARAYTPFHSPLAVVTYEPIAELLSTIGVSRKAADGTWTFDVRAYLHEVRWQRRWSSIPGTVGYRNDGYLLLRTTNPRDSQSASMFVAIASYLLNNGAVVADDPAIKAIVPTLAPCFTRQGSLDARTPQLLANFRRAGMRDMPMALAYENDAIVEIRNHAGRSPRMTLMYPSLDVSSRNTVIPLTDRGRRLAELLTSDRLQRLGPDVGYRNGQEPDQFVRQMAAQGVRVRRDVVSVPPPAPAILRRLIDEAYPAR